MLRQVTGRDAGGLSSWAPNGEKAFEFCTWRLLDGQGASWRREAAAGKAKRGMGNSSETGAEFTTTGWATYFTEKEKSN